VGEDGFCDARLLCKLQAPPFSAKKEGNEFPRSPQHGPYIGSVQNLHQPAAADRDGLTGLDVLGAVADMAVHEGYTIQEKRGSFSARFL